MACSYFLISVSNRRNLDLCIRYALAGFTNSINGVWTFLEISDGDYISFLYGAKAHNLYRVEEKIALKEAQNLPPWEPVTFKQSGKTYYFPFRLKLKPIRTLEEPLVRAEFAYVAENLLLRGGYRRTHFQADQTTLQAVSQMGTLWKSEIEPSDIKNIDMFIPKFTKSRLRQRIPEVFSFQELILQTVIRKYLSEKENLEKFLSSLKIQDVSAKELEVLGEKAFPEGHVDILIKESAPVGISRKIIIEVKTGVANRQDLNQLRSYTDEIGDECVAAVLIADKFQKSVVKDAQSCRVRLVSYSFKEASMRDLITFDDLFMGFCLKELNI